MQPQQSPSTSSSSSTKPSYPHPKDSSPQGQQPSGSQIDRLHSPEERVDAVLSNLGIRPDQPLDQQEDRFHDAYSGIRELTHELDPETLYEAGDIVPATADYEVMDADGNPTDLTYLTLTEGDIFPELRSAKGNLYKLHLEIFP